MEQNRSKKSSDVVLAVVTLGVIAVIFIVIFYPVFFRSGHEMPRKSWCMTNMREIGLSFAMYLNDNNGKLPSSGICGSSDRTYRQTLGKLPPPARGKKTVAQLLYPYKKNLELYFCPSDPVLNVGFWPFRSTRPPKSADRPSYVLKRAIDLAWKDPKIKARREKDYLYPSEQVLFYEHSSFHWGGDPISGRAGANFNVCYFDLHVKTVRLQDPKIEPDYYNWIPEAARPTGKRQIDPRKYCDKLPY